MHARRRVIFAPSYYTREAHEGIAQYAREHDWELIADQAPMLKAPHDWHGDGVIAYYNGRKSEISRFLKSVTEPVINIGDQPHQTGAPHIAIDERHTGCLAARHFLERGFRRFLVLLTSSHNPVRKDLPAGFRRELQSEGLDCTVRAVPKRLLHHRTYPSWIHQQVRKHQLPLAILVDLPFDAVIIERALLDAGYNIPDEISILARGDHNPACNFAPVPLSAIELPYVRLGYEGARVLDAILDGIPPPDETVLIKPYCVVSRESTQTIAAEDQRVKTAIAYIRSHFMEEISTEHVARASHTSRRTLERNFRRELGRSVHEEIVRNRVAHAKQLLKTTNSTCASIAYDAGFATEKTFYRTFRTHVCMTPLDYRNLPLRNNTMA